MAKSSRKATEYDDMKKHSVIALRNAGHTFNFISSQLDMPISTVHSIYNKYKKSGSTDNLKRSGHPQKLSERELKRLDNLITVHAGGRRLELGDITDKINSKRLSPVHPHTIRNALNKQLEF